ncbi:MAG: hypothetical protein KDK34_17150 [Leptospiraceae bacterium]|nr:hypothetical protein [Leptospiraceae bacterium]MCB1321988.1 hypothetical protein [Leptospiraceae bacterium]
MNSRLIIKQFIKLFQSIKSPHRNRAPAQNFSSRAEHTTLPLKIFRVLVAGLIICTLPTCSQLLGEDDEDDTDELVALLLLAQSTGGCTIGGQSFTAGSGVTCSNGVASGTGTLIATGTKDEFVSMSLSFQLGSGGQLDVIGGANPNTNFVAGNGPTFRISSTAAAKTISDNDATLTSPGTSAATWCLDFHLEESPPHVIGDTSACVPKATSSAGYEDDDDTNAKAGGRWGFILTNATINGAVFNSSENYSD